MGSNDNGVDASIALPVSMIQKQFWLLQQVHPDDSSYNMPTVFQLQGNLDPVRLEAAIASVINRHASLRAKYKLNNERVTCFAEAYTDYRLPVVDLQQLPDSQQDEELFDIILAAIAEPFDLECDSPVRSVLIKLSAIENFLVLVIHHIAIDLKSKEIIGEELSAAYNNEEMPVAALQYQNYIDWFAELQATDVYEKKKKFWKKQFENHSYRLELPFRKQIEGFLPYQGEEILFNFTADEYSLIQKFSASNNVITFVALLLCYYITLHSFSKQDELVLGVPLSNRQQHEHKLIVGCFVNILPMKIAIQQSDSLQTVLKKLRMVMVASHRNQEVPLMQIVEELNPDRSMQYNPLFQAGFTFEPPMQLQLHAVVTQPVVIHNGGSQLELFMNLWPQQDELCGRLEYCAALFAENDIVHFVNRFQNITRKITATLELSSVTVADITNIEECVDGESFARK